MRKVTKIDIVGDTKQRKANSHSNTKLLKYASIIFYVAAGLIAVGCSAKIINFTLINLKAVASTIKEY